MVSAWARKTEVAILTKKRIPTFRLILIGELIKKSKPTVKYPGLMLDSKMIFFAQIKVEVDETVVNRRRFLLSASSLLCSTGWKNGLMFLAKRCIVSVLRKCRRGELRGWVDYFLTWLLRYHISFQFYLHKIGKNRPLALCFSMGTTIFFLWKVGLVSSATLCRHGEHFVCVKCLLMALSFLKPRAYEAEI